MKNKLLLLAGVLVLVLTAKSFAQTDSVKWALTNDSSAIAGGHVNSLSNPEIVSNLVVRGYATTNNITGQKVAVNDDGTWVGSETGPVNDRYVQFGLLPLSGYSFTVTSISFYAGWTGSSYIYANAYYSTDSTFTTKTMLQANMAPGSTPFFYSFSTLNITVNDGQQLYIRFYPWATRAVSGKNFGIGQLAVKGTTSSVRLPSMVVSPGSLSFNRVKVGESKDLLVTLSGLNLNPETDSIRITAPIGFLVSSTLTAGFSSTLALPYSGSKLNLDTVYVRFAPSLIKTYADTVGISGGGVIPQSVMVTGLAVDSSTILHPPAFPTAEGYGKITVGGRGGVLYEVTNLNDDGLPGSLRYAVNQSGPRTVVFRVSGTITLNSNLNISNPYITIAGQTAPGDGICLRKYTLNIGADEVIIRYIRVRYGDEIQTDADAVSMRYHKNIILDHVSASWGDDETMSLYHGQNVTIQWCMVYETLNRGGSHGFAGIWGSNYSTYHHNLISNCVSRCIRWASGSQNSDYRNNVIYNWGYNSSYGGEKQQEGDTNFSFTNINMVVNYYKPGPGTSSNVNHRIVNPSTRNGAADYGKWYIADNDVVGNATVTADNWNGGVNPGGGSADIPYIKLDVPWPAMSINQQTAESAYQSVLADVGCSLPKRDAADTRIISEVTNGTSTYGTNGIIQSQTEVGGWPVLNSLTAPADDDHDGMPNAWELAHSLNPNDPADRNNFGQGGYTMLEVYLNHLTGELTSVNGYSLDASRLKEFELYQNYPNPFNPTTILSFQLARSSHTTLKIYDVYGREVSVLVDGMRSAGMYKEQFHAQGLASGVYFARLQTTTQSQTIKIMLMK